MAHVLVVDDDDQVRLIFRVLLEAAAYTVDEATDGEQALQCLRASPHGLVVVLDLNMPGQDGLQVLQTVAEHESLASRHAFIMATGADQYMFPPALAALLTRFNVRVLSKPVTRRHLLEAVQQAEARLVCLSRPPVLVRPASRAAAPAAADVPQRTDADRRLVESAALAYACVAGALRCLKRSQATMQQALSVLDDAEHHLPRWRMGRAGTPEPPPDDAGALAVAASATSLRGRR